jgi:flagellar basal-body rod protein FlgC
MSMLGSFDIGTTGLIAQSVRLNLVASNLANAETVVSADGQAYRARQAVFQVAKPTASAGVAPARLEYRPNHPLANEAGYVAMPNVNVAEQTVDMISASRAYQTNIEVMNISRQLLLKTLDLGK